MRTVDWHGDHLRIVEQTLLPDEVRVVELRSVDDVIDAVVRLAVRGAPALGVTGGLGVALSAVTARAQGHTGATLGERVARDAARLRAARPTAVNLAWGVDRVLGRLAQAVDGDVDVLVAEAVAMLDEDVATNRALAGRGADLLVELAGRRGTAPPLRLLTHCNAGGLACVEWGTALGVVRALHERGQLAEVYADETRPLLQGARITAFELAAMGVAHRVVVDGAGPSAIARGLVDGVVVGADRVTANGDVVNKVGTYPLALAAARAGVPFVVAAPESTVDLHTPSGDDVEIEERSHDEVLAWRGVRTAPAGSGAWNPAFDVTPADLVTAVVTQRRTIRGRADGPDR